ncbi:hypothetical protein JYU34_021238 [Plutella xylostella]|uniref:Uncharacterized protein n=1 Tax=Plutella xylostella TaxID=51655 RepID=A0ABQ7PT48_PLUXY|nr:hypothetical protein JYU34_021238 [Plutella xylostella]
MYQQLDQEDDEEATDLTASAAVAFEVDPDKIEVRYVPKTRRLLTASAVRIRILGNK